jgi:hypothetical protein
MRLAGSIVDGAVAGGIAVLTGLAETPAGELDEDAAVATVSAAGCPLHPKPTSEMLPNRRTAAGIPNRG